MDEGRCWQDQEALLSRLMGARGTNFRFYFQRAANGTGSGAPSRKHGKDVIRRAKGRSCRDSWAPGGRGLEDFISTGAQLARRNGRTLESMTELLFEGPKLFEDPAQKALRTGKKYQPCRQDFEISKLQDFKIFRISRFQGFKISRFQDFRISRFQDFKIQKILKS